MKNIRNIMLIVLIAATAVFMTGCTEDEIAMLNLINESQSLTQYRIDGIYGQTFSVSSDSQNADIQYTYEANKDVPDGGYMHLKINGTLCNIVLKEPLEFYSYGNKFYVSKNLLRYLNDARQLGDENDLTYLLDELDSTVLKDTDFLVCEGNDDPISFVITLISKFDKNMDLLTLDIGVVGVLSRDLIDKADYNKSAISFLTDAYDGFESEAVSKIDGGYQLTFGASRLIDTLTNFAEFTYAHRDEIYAKDVYYTNLFYDSIPCPDDETLEKVETLRSADLPDEQKFIRDTDELYNRFHYGSEFFNSKESAMDFIGGNYCSYSITENEGSYKNIERGLITLTDPNDKNHSENAQLYHEQTKTPANVNVNLPQRTMQYSDYSIKSEAAKNRINPCVGLEIKGSAFNDTAMLQPAATIREDNNYRRLGINFILKKILKNGDTERIVYKKNSNVISYNYPITILVDENERICVPLRFIAENLGEEVVWDEITESVSILQYNELIPIDGFLFKPEYANNDCYFCRIREFEKLGYTIEYNEEPNEYSNVRKNITVKVSKGIQPIQ